MMAKGVRGRRALRIYDGVDRDPRMANERVSPPDSIDMTQMIADSLTNKPFPRRQRPGGSPSDTVYSMPTGTSLIATDTVGTFVDGNIPVMGPGKISKQGNPDANFDPSLIPGLAPGNGDDSKAATVAGLGNKSATGHGHGVGDVTNAASKNDLAHSHDGRYSADNHNHDRRYAPPVGNGSSNHNHTR